MSEQPKKTPCCTALLAHVSASRGTPHLTAPPTETQETQDAYVNRACETHHTFRGRSAVFFQFYEQENKMATYELIIERRQPPCGGKPPKLYEFLTVQTEDPNSPIRMLFPVIYCYFSQKQQIQNFYSPFIPPHFKVCYTGKGKMGKLIKIYIAV